MDTCTKVSDVNTPEQQLDMLRKYGYAGIAWTAEEPAKVGAVAHAAAERHVPMLAIYMGAHLAKEGLEADSRLPAIAQALKGHGTILWLHIGSTAFAPSSAEGDALAVPELRRIADVAASNGLRVAIYPHTGDWAERVGDAVRLAKQVNRANFGVTFNLCHSLMVGEEARIPALLKEAMPYLFVVTINGADSGAARTTWERLIRPLGEGSYDVSAFLRELDRAGYCGPIAVQGYGIQLAPDEQLARSMKAWRAICK
jgi:sugar phosphate isomerase/epimerase